MAVSNLDLVANLFDGVMSEFFTAAVFASHIVCQLISFALYGKCGFKRRG